jgi:hypothetical protein
MDGNELRDKIEVANHEAVTRMMEAEPVLVDVGKALDVVPGMGEHVILHSGPPVSWDRMSVPQRQAIIGSILHERLAGSVHEAQRKAERGDILIEACHDHGCVGSMTGITSASTPVFVVKNVAHGNYAYHQIFFDGAGPQASRLTLGVYDEKVEEALCWRRDHIAPALRRAIHAAEGINLKAIISRALTMGDECHSRCWAATYRATLELLPHLLRAGVANDVVIRWVEMSTENGQTFLFLCLPACKAIADAAHHIPYSTVVTCLARNGTDSGIKVSGLGDSWFTAPSPPVTKALYFSSRHGPKDACLDMGDSSITETVGLGGFMMSNAPAFVEMIGGTMEDALRYTREMEEITVTKNRNFPIPLLNFEGSPLGIDIRKVVEQGITPVCDTGIAGKEGELIGIGVSRQPMQMFKKALRAFAEKMG